MCIRSEPLAMNAFLLALDASAKPQAAHVNPGKPVKLYQSAKKTLIKAS
jgi:hypothetical protein